MSGQNGSIPNAATQIDIYQDVVQAGLPALIRNPSERLVLMHLAYSATRKVDDPHYRMAYPKQETIAAATGLTVRTVRTATKALAAKGLIQRKRLMWNKSAQEFRTGKLYWYLFPDYPELCDLAESLASAKRQPSDRPFPAEVQGKPVSPEHRGNGDPLYRGNGDPLRSEKEVEREEQKVEEGVDPHFSEVKTANVNPEPQPPRPAPEPEDLPSAKPRMQALTERYGLDAEAAFHLARDVEAQVAEFQGDGQKCREVAHAYLNQWETQRNREPAAIPLAAIFPAEPAAINATAFIERANVSTALAAD